MLYILFSLLISTTAHADAPVCEIDTALKEIMRENSRILRAQRETTPSVVRDSRMSRAQIQQQVHGQPVDLTKPNTNLQLAFQKLAENQQFEGRQTPVEIEAMVDGKMHTYEGYFSKTVDGKSYLGGVYDKETSKYLTNNVLDPKNMPFDVQRIEVLSNDAKWYDNRLIYTKDPAEQISNMRMRYDDLDNSKMRVVVQRPGETPGTVETYDLEGRKFQIKPDGKVITYKGETSSGMAHNGHEILAGQEKIDQVWVDYKPQIWRVNPSNSRQLEREIMPGSDLVVKQKTGPTIRIDANAVGAPEYLGAKEVDGIRSLVYRIGGEIKTIPISNIEQVETPGGSMRLY